MSKNELQEIFQKKRLPLPNYITIRIDGDRSIILWKSTVSITLSVVNSKRKTLEITGSAHPSKILAETSAASRALEYLKKSPLFFYPIEDRFVLKEDEFEYPASREEIKLEFIEKPPVKTILTKPKTDVSVKKRSLSKATVLLVDVENIPKIIEELLSKIQFCDNFWIYAFVGKHHPQASALENINNDKVIKILSPSTRKDGTDTCMQLYVGMFLCKEMFEEYLVCTRDHFGGTLVEFISSFNEQKHWKTQNASLVTTVDHIIKVLDKI